jgi:hypothetical protein
MGPVKIIDKSCMDHNSNIRDIFLGLSCLNYFESHPNFLFIGR